VSQRYPPTTVRRREGFDAPIEGVETCIEFDRITNYVWDYATDYDDYLGIRSWVQDDDFPSTIPLTTRITPYADPPSESMAMESFPLTFQRAVNFAIDDYLLRVKPTWEGPQEEDPDREKDRRTRRMSLDIYLTVVRSTVVFETNLTHNLIKIARAAGLYQHLWRPDELGLMTAQELIEPLQAGLARLLNEPVVFKALNPENGWGTYEGLVEAVRDYLMACQENPDALVTVSR